MVPPSCSIERHMSFVVDSLLWISFLAPDNISKLKSKTSICDETPGLSHMTHFAHTELLSHELICYAHAHGHHSRFPAIGTPCLLNCHHGNWNTMQNALDLLLEKETKEQTPWIYVLRSKFQRARRSVPDCAACAHLSRPMVHQDLHTVCGLTLHSKAACRQ